MCVAPGNPVGYRHPFFLTLVREHRSAHAVAYRPNVFGAGAALIINYDETALVNLDARAFGQETCRVGPATYGHHHAIGYHGLLAFGVGIIDHYAIFPDGRAADTCAEARLQSLFAKLAHRLASQLLISHWQKGRQRFEQCHLASQPSPDAA